MPSEPGDTEPGPRWPSAAESSATLALAPEIDGPPRRTSGRTPAVLAAGAAPLVIFAVLVAWIAVPIALAFLGYGILSWRRRSYRVGSTELVVDEGILTRRRRVVPYDRVQEVDTRQNLAARLFGVGELRVATAGGSQDAKLSYLEMPRAEGLREHILRRRAELQRTGTTAPDGAMVRAADGAASDTAPPPTLVAAGTDELLALTPSRLVLASVTHGSVLAGAAGGFVIGLWAGAAVALGARFQLAVLLGGGLVAGLAVALASGTVIVLRNLVERHGFTVSVRGDDIQLRYGLLDVRHLSVPRRRVQQVTVVDNPIRRALGIVSLELHSASAGGDVTQFEIPILDRAELDGLLTAMMGTDAWRPPERIARNARARARGVRRRVAVSAILLAPPAVALFPIGLPILALAALGVPWGVVAHRRAGHGLSATLVSVRHGVFRHRVDLVPLSRVQSCRTRASPFQRHARLATFHVDVAGGQAPYLYDLEATTGAALMRDLPRRSARAA